MKTAIDLSSDSKIEKIDLHHSKDEKMALQSKDFPSILKQRERKENGKDKMKKEMQQDGEQREMESPRVHKRASSND